jgi:signal transduction histidine kinase
VNDGRSLGSIIARAVTLQTLVVVVVVGLVASALLLERSASADQRHAQASLLDLGSFEFQVLNAETGLRGFALAHREPFLQPYDEAFPAIARLEPRLLRAVSERDRRPLSQAFRVLADWRANFAEIALREFRSAHEQRAQRLIDQGAGKRRIDQIRALVSAVRDDENASLAAAGRRRRLVSGLVAGALALALIGAVLAGLRMARTLRRAVVAPIDELATTADQVRGGNLGARAAPEGAAELAGVAGAFNEMAAEVQQVVVGLREVDDLKTSFLATVNHELRTPLTTINGYLQLLAHGIAGELTPEQLEYIQIAQRNGERLAALIDDLLTLSRLDAGKIDLTRESVDLARQLRHLRVELEPMAERADAHIELDAPPELVVEGDPRRLEQSFSNLLSNAIKFNRPGGTVRINAQSRDGEAIVEVVDEGPGIPASELARIGERFFRASTTANKPGTGLGVAITREIIERHGGRLEIDSQVGKGSSFRIVLPRG